MPNIVYISEAINIWIINFFCGNNKCINLWNKPLVSSPVWKLSDFTRSISTPLHWYFGGFPSLWTSPKNSSGVSFTMPAPGSAITTCFFVILCITT